MRLNELNSTSFEMDVFCCLQQNNTFNIEAKKNIQRERYANRHAIF